MLLLRSSFKRTMCMNASCAAFLLISGCASTRVNSNVEGTAPTESAVVPIALFDHGLPARKFTDLGPIKVSVRKLTVFNANPTKEMADEALMQRARVLGADAVINVKYEFGVGMTTWGYMDAAGQAIKFVR